MKIFIAVLICKAVYFVGKQVGRGSSLPGKIVLKLFPDILKYVKMPKTVVAVTGSNGKTSTVDMIAHIMQNNGINVVWNKEGANQIEGVTTFLLNNADFKGNINADAVLLESDERYARLIFKYFTPSHMVVTNLYRDQMTRNGHFELIYSIIKDAVKPETVLVLNANDPLVSCFANDHDKDKVVYFSMDKNKYSTDLPVSVYNDGVYCPNCKSKLKYDYFTLAHNGQYHCENCGLQTEKALCRVTDMDLDEKKIVLDGEYEITLGFASAFNVYNMLAAFTLACTLGYNKQNSIDALNKYVLKTDRVIEVDVGTHKGYLLSSKHENSVSYNQSIDYIVRNKNKTIVMLYIDDVSKRYQTTEISWLWDINFDKLKEGNIEKIILGGRHAYDLAVRFEFTDIDPEKIIIANDMEQVANAVLGIKDDSDFYAMIYIADKEKILSKLCGGENA